MTARRALLCLIVVSGGLRLGWASAVGLGHDEAYHYLFTVHRDWSYFDHPPMLALVESAGTTLLGSAAPGRCGSGSWSCSRGRPGCWRGSRPAPSASGPASGRPWR